LLRSHNEKFSKADVLLVLPGFEGVLRGALLGAEFGADEVDVEAVDGAVSIGVVDEEDVEGEGAEGSGELPVRWRRTRHDEAPLNQ
jgi:hypothetical protein